MKTWKKHSITLITTLVIVAPYLVMAAGSESSSLSNPFGSSNTNEPIYIIARIIQALLGVVGAVTLLVFIWGGFKLIFSGGEEDKITKGKSTLVWAVIGLAIILASYSILDYTFNLLQTAASPVVTPTAS